MKMKKYLVTATETYKYHYKVKAESKKEAIHKVEFGKGVSNNVVGGNSSRRCEAEEIK